MGIRIRIARDKAELVQKLVASEDTTGPFQTYADVIAFAAAMGSRYRLRLPLASIAREPSPITMEIFLSRGYDLLIKLLAIAETEDPKIVSPYETLAEAQRAKIFEEYANGGLEKLAQELKGAVDYTERILLILTQQQFKPEASAEEFDLTKFI